MSTFGDYSYPQTKSPAISRLINDRLSVNKKLSQLRSAYQHVAQDVDRTTLVAL